MRTSLDTNIVSGLWSGGPAADAIRLHLRDCRAQGTLFISPIVFAELLANPDLTHEALVYFLEKTGIEVMYEIDPAVWVMAGQRFARHAVRRRKATTQGPRRLIADFIIGAHTLLSADRLMTLDDTFYIQDFRELSLYPVPLA